MYFEKFENSDYFSTQESHKDYVAADHINEVGQAPRIYKTAQWVNDLIAANPNYTVIDYGCGSGGLLSILETDSKIGYDFMPSNVQFAQERARPVEFCDFISEMETMPSKFVSHIAVITECLEHLLDPIKFLDNVDAEWLVMSMPDGETNAAHYELHTHGADREGCRDLMLKATGWEPIMFHFEEAIGTQLWLAKRNNIFK